MKKSLFDKIFDGVNILLMCIIVFVCVYPIYYVIVASVSNPDILQQHTGMLLYPLGFTLKGYELVFNSSDILGSYLNTVVYVFTATVLNIGMTSLAAFVLSRRNFMWGKALMKMVTFTMFFSGGLIPFYITMKNLGMIDNRLVMILPGAISTWNLIVMRNSFMSIPVSLEEAFKIDGGNDWHVFWRLIMPLSKAIIAVMVLFYAVSHWNAWFYAMVFLRDRSKYPLQLILREILLSNDTGEMMTGIDTAGAAGNRYRVLIQYTTIVAGTLPVLIIYPFVQKYFVKGVMVGSVKG